MTFHRNLIQFKKKEEKLLGDRVEVKKSKEREKRHVGNAGHVGHTGPVTENINNTSTKTYISCDSGGCRLLSNDKYESNKLPRENRGFGGRNRQSGMGTMRTGGCSSCGK